MVSALRYLAHILAKKINRYLPVAVCAGSVRVQCVFSTDLTYHNIIICRFPAYFCIFLNVFVLLMRILFRLFFLWRPGTYAAFFSEYLAYFKMTKWKLWCRICQNCVHQNSLKRPIALQTRGWSASMQLLRILRCDWNIPKVCQKKIVKIWYTLLYSLVCVLNCISGLHCRSKYCWSWFLAIISCSMGPETWKSWMGNLH